MSDSLTFLLGVFGWYLVGLVSAIALHIPNWWSRRGDIVIDSAALIHAFFGPMMTILVFFTLLRDAFNYLDRKPIVILKRRQVAPKATSTITPTPNTGTTK